MPRRNITVKLDDQEIEVKKLPIGKYAELLQAVQEFPKHIQQFQGANEELLISVLPTMIAESLPDVVRVVAIATPLKPEEVEQLGLDELTRVIVAVFEVNNYQEVYENIKKVMAQSQKSVGK